MRKKIIVINAILYALLFGLITLNKEILRPATYTKTGFQTILTDCFPNFIAVYLISLVAVVGVLFRKPKRARFIVYTSAIVVAVVLIVEEVKPMWGASEVYDLYDIVASCVGALFTILSYEIVKKLV